MNLDYVRPGVRFIWRRSRDWKQHKPKVVVSYDPEWPTDGGRVVYRVVGGGIQPQKCCGLYFVENAIISGE